VYIPDLAAETYNDHVVDGELTYRSVGWLGNRVERQGETDPEIVTRLQQIQASNQLSDNWRGLHDCEICKAEKVVWPESDKGEFFVEQGSIRYILPNMVIHYITRHDYKLPESVEQAVREWRG